jgi:choline dehydrogenase-like flavoprotein
MKLSKEQIEALEAICNTFIPSITKEEDPDNYWKREGTDLPVVENIIDTISSLPIEDQEEFIELLDLLNSRKLGFLWLGPLKKITSLTKEQKTAFLRSWAGSTIPKLRGGFLALKKLVGTSYFGCSLKGKANPSWATIKYPGVLKGTDKEINQTKGLNIQKVESGGSFHCDVVVIGSGAGGGVVASELAKAGYDVVVLEKGAYISEKEMTASEAEMLNKAYDRKGAFTSVDGAVSLLAGSCIGGGTTINWSASFRTPDYILDEWATEHDNPQFKDPAYKECFDFIEKRTSVNTKLSQHNKQNEFLFEGAKKLGYHSDVIPRNVAPPNASIDKDKYWKSQGYGGLGDSFGYKMGTMKTFLQDASDHGTRIFANTRADKVKHSKGEVTGVIAHQKDENGHQRRIHFHCKKVVVSAGALHTPAILMRSGLEHPQIGQNLYLHPVNAVSARYDEPVEGWYGPMMSAVSDEFTQLDGNFGYKLETPPVHSGLSALSLPWISGEQYKSEMLDISKTATFIVLTRDKFGGKVVLSKEGRPRVHYKLHKYDKKHLIHGIKESAKIHFAAGAKEISLLHNDYHKCRIGKDDFEHFLKKIDRISWAANRFILFSAHQMGTCRMGGRAKDHPLKPTGETREIKNLFVADASAFPRCSGVNPMLSIQALSYYISKQIINS